MKATIALIVVLSTVASADTYKLGIKESLKHGCATPHGAAVMADFLKKDPSFTFNGGKAVLTLSMPTNDHRGVHEKSWAGEALSPTIAHWDMPRNEDAGTQVRLLIDLDPIQWCNNAACTLQMHPDPRLANPRLRSRAQRQARERVRRIVVRPSGAAVMGAERIAPGKQTMTQTANANTAAAVSSPGKATQVDRMYGNAGGKVTAGDNFLNDVDRGNLVAEYVGRVNAALSSYLTAASDLRVDKLTEKEEEFPILGTLLLVAGGKAAESVVMGACTLLRQSGRVASELAEAGVRSASHEAEGKILGMSEKSVETIIATATDQAKDKLKASAAVALGAEQTETKGQVLSFVDYLRDAAMGLFQRFREWPIGRVTDAQLLALFTAFEGSRHTPTMYRRIIGQHIQKYMASHAKEIGHKEARQPGKLTSSRKETRVAYVTDGTNPPMLAYVENEYTQKDTPHGGGSQAGAAYNANQNALGFEEQGSWSDSGGSFRGAADEGELKLLGYVEPELRDVALSTHQQRWAQTPATYTVHYPSMSLTKGEP